MLRIGHAGEIAGYAVGRLSGAVRVIGPVTWSGKLGQHRVRVYRLVFGLEFLNDLLALLFRNGTELRSLRASLFADTQTRREWVPL